MTAHAYARILRGHILVYVALCQKILSEIIYSDEETECITKILEIFENDPPVYNNIEENSILNAINKKFFENILEIERRGSTAKLWIQYVRMVAIAKSFMRSEKKGNFKLQLNIIKQMLPYFHTCGHINYPKSAHLYIQKMEDFINEMDEKYILHAQEGTQHDPTIQEYQNFIQKGFCTVRCIDKFWSGNYTDMIIEQDLMRIMKSTGGRVQRGFTESTENRWIISLPYSHDTCLLYTSRCV